MDKVKVIIKKDRKGKVTESISIPVNGKIKTAGGVQVENAIYGKHFEIDYSTGKVTWWWIGYQDDKMVSDIVYTD